MTSSPPKGPPPDTITRGSGLQQPVCVWGVRVRDHNIQLRADQSPSDILVRHAKDTRYVPTQEKAREDREQPASYMPGRGLGGCSSADGTLILDPQPPGLTQQMSAGRSLLPTSQRPLHAGGRVCSLGKVTGLGASQQGDASCTMGPAAGVPRYGAAGMKGFYLAMKPGSRSPSQSLWSCFCYLCLFLWYSSP